MENYELVVGGEVGADLNLHNLSYINQADNFSMGS